MTLNVNASTWIGTRNGDDYWVEGEKCEVQVELTDQDEVRLGIHLDPGGSQDAGVYLTRQEAERLAKFLAAAAADVLRVPVGKHGI